MFIKVRNFNCHLPNAHSNAIDRSYSSSLPNKTVLDEDAPEGFPIDTSHSEKDITDDNLMFTNEDISLTSSTESAGPQVLFQPLTNMSLDEDGRVKPYVDFSDFYAAVEEAYKSGLVTEDWLKPRS